jgi:hypothetical protein
MVSKNQLPQSQQAKNEVILTWGLNGGGSVISSQAGLYLPPEALYINRICKRAGSVI